MSNSSDKTNTPPQTVQWIGYAASGHLRLIEQSVLPESLEYVDCRDVESVWQAIKRLAVRGAPAIGVAAAYGCVIGAQQGTFEASADYLATSRPTAVNLFWAIERMKSLGTEDVEALLAEAKAIHAEDTAMCRAIGEHGAALIQPGDAVLTHCNAGALATAGIGTATAPMYVAHESGVPFKVYADETRPLLQGARLTAWELSRAGVDVTVLCDNMAAVLLRDGQITRVITGADRIAANGDAANKIGTYGLAVMAKHHGVPFHIAAPSSTFDLATATGADIPIEQRDGAEVAQGFGPRTAPQGAAVYNPAFDVTPHELIASIITERGIIEPVNPQTVAAMMNATG
jgi:methylthioribose-1-phosphate isomerase